MEMLYRFEKFEEEKAKQKAINAEIGRKRQLTATMRASGSFEFEGSSSMPSTNVMKPFHYVPPPELDRQPKKKKNIKSYFPPSPNSVSGSQTTQIQPTLDSHWKNQYKASAFEYIARWWYDADIPFNAACLPYYQPMWDFVIATRKGFKGPNMYDLMGSVLQKEVLSIDEYLEHFKDSWARIGCSIMSNGWIDGKNRKFINFLVSCPQGTMFLKSIDASDKVQDANLLFDLLDKIVVIVGVENVVKAITDNASYYVLDSKMLEAKYRTIFWTPCAAHCIALMLEEIGKQDWIKNVVEHAKCVIKYIYNHSWVLNLMRKNTGGKELVRPAIMRFETHFLTLQSLISQAHN
jgi:hypothetical protein